MIHLSYLAAAFIFLQSGRASGSSAVSGVGHHHHARCRVVQHSEGVFDRFVIRAADRDSFPAHNRVGVAILAENILCPRHSLTPGFGADEKCRSRGASGLSGTFAARGARLPLPDAFDLGSFERHLMPLCLSLAILAPPRRRGREAEIISHLRASEWPGINHQRVASRVRDRSLGFRPRSISDARNATRW